MKHIDVNEVYTLFEEIKELVKKGNESKQTVIQPEVQPKIELPDFSEINELTDKLDKTIEEVRKPVKTEHHHIFSIYSNKIFLSVMAMGIGFLVSLFVIYSQQEEIGTYKGNDLKYRYILMQGEVSLKELNQLEFIFENRRDSVKIIRNRVKQYEKTIFEEAKRLEQARLKGQEAEQLKQEAENLKQKDSFAKQ